MDSLFDDGLMQPAPRPATVDVEALWQACLQELQFAMEEKEFNQWIRPLQVRLDGQSLVLLAPNTLWVRQIQNDHLKNISQLAAQLSHGKVGQVRVEQAQSAPLAEKPTEKKPRAKKSAQDLVESDALDTSFTFESFVKGKSNTLAYNACYELSKKEGKHDYSTVFIYGSSGLGKTHLMHAMAHRFHKHGKSFCYFTKDHFFKETQKAFRDGKIEDFIKKICKMDLLIIDDVHLINNKSGPKVSEILIRLFSQFSKDKNKQVVLASDRRPSQMKDFDERFLSRFASALSLPIEPPDMEMRVQILEKKAAMLELSLPKDCAIFMAQNLPPDVRGLEGSLKQVAMTATLRGEPVTLSLVHSAIKDSIEARARALNAENIRDVVAEYYEVSPKDLMSKKRARHIARPRQMAMALIRELTRDSFPEIGQVFGGRDHTTVMHACDKIEELKLSDPTLAKDYQSLKMMLEYV